MPKVRLNLALPTEPRDSSFSKDALVKNAFIESSKAGVAYLRKRPALVFGSGGVTVGNNRGIFYHNGTLWAVNSGNGLQGYIPSPGFSGTPYVVVSNEDFV